MTELDDNNEQAHHVPVIDTFLIPQWAQVLPPLSRFPNGITEAGMKRAATHTLGYFMGAREGEQPGHFTSAMIEALSVADPTNWGLVYRSFPELAACVRLYKNVDGGLEYLRELIKSA